MTCIEMLPEDESQTEELFKSIDGNNVIDLGIIGWNNRTQLLQRFHYRNFNEARRL